MSEEIIAKFLATVGFKEDKANSLDKLLQSSRKKLETLGGAAIAPAVVKIKEMRQEVTKLKKELNASGKPARGDNTPSAPRPQNVNKLSAYLNKTYAQAMNFDRPLAYTQIESGLQGVREALASTDPVMTRYRAHWEKLGREFEKQKATKQGVELANNTKKSMNSVIQTLNTGSKDIAGRLGEELKGLTTEREASKNKALAGLKEQRDAGKLTKDQFKQMSAEISQQYEVTSRSAMSFDRRVKAGLKSVRGDVKTVISSMKDLKVKLADQGAALAKAMESGDKGLIGREQRKLKAVQQLYKEHEKYLTRLRKQKAQLHKTSLKSEELAVKSSLGRASRMYRTYFQRLARMVTSTRTIMTSVVAPLIAGAGIAKIGHTNRRLIAIDIAMKSASLTAKSYADNMMFVRQQTSRLGLDFKTIAPEYTKIAASGRLMGLSGDQIKESFLGIAEASVAMQLPAEDIKGTIRALTQMLAKGTVQAEELKGQLGERIPAAFPLAAKAMGVTTKELAKMLEQGQILSHEFVPKFAKELRNFAAPGLDEAISSFNAEIGRTTTHITNFLGALGDAGLVDIFNTSMKMFRMALSAVELPLKMVTRAANALTTPLRTIVNLLSESSSRAASGEEGYDTFTKFLWGLAAWFGLGIIGKLSGKFKKLFGFLKGKFPKLAAGALSLRLALGGVITKLTGGSFAAFSSKGLAAFAGLNIAATVFSATVLSAIAVAAVAMEGFLTDNYTIADQLKDNWGRAGALIAAPFEYIETLFRNMKRGFTEIFTLLKAMYDFKNGKITLLQLKEVAEGAFKGKWNSREETEKSNRGQNVDMGGPLQSITKKTDKGLLRRLLTSGTFGVTGDQQQKVLKMYAPEGLTEEALWEHPAFLGSMQRMYRGNISVAQGRPRNSTPEDFKRSTGTVGGNVTNNITNNIYGADDADLILKVTDTLVEQMNTNSRGPE